MDIRIFTKFWLDQQFSCQYGGKGSKKWETLTHNGVWFPPEYTKHNIPVIYDGENIILEPLAEEIATMYAKYIDTEYVNNNKFNSNFWNDWKKTLTNTKIKSLDKCDFGLISEYLVQQKLANKNNKKDNSQLDIYKTAIVDGKSQPVGNFRMEPPGLFIGRGCNPLIGKVKKRIYPKDITLNIGKGVDIPKPNVKGEWGRVIHDQTVEWLASWIDTITGKTKYVWLGQHSDMKNKNDLEKFELARKLKRKIKHIRAVNDKNLLDSDTKIKQIATAVYLIDELALRVGNEKSEDQADTVGVTSLRVEHVRTEPDNVIVLDFLGKDSIRYYNKTHVDPVVYNNISEFIKGKSKDDDLFDKIKSNDINKYLNSFMKGLTAKCLRTMAASSLFQQELNKLSDKVNEDTPDRVNILLNGYNKANSKVALLCNHQKAVSKSFDKQLKNINNLIKQTKDKLKSATNPDKLKKYREKLKRYKAKKALKMQLKTISLGTSKQNYIDPRITIAFMKKHNLPVEKVFSKTLQTKFKWAFDVDSSFQF